MRRGGGGYFDGARDLETLQGKRTVERPKEAWRRSIEEEIKTARGRRGGRRGRGGGEEGGGGQESGTESSALESCC